MQVTPTLNAGGVETVTLEIARAAAKAGARSLVASRGGRLEGELVEAGGELIRLPVDSRNPVTIAVNARHLEAIIRRERVDLVHVRSRAPAFSAIAAARRAGVPAVTSYHGIYGARSPLKRWYNGVMTRGDLTIANSEFTRDHVLAEHGVDPGKVVVVPEGIDAARFDPATVSDERIEALRTAWGLDVDDLRRVILLPARLTGWKGQRVMIEALGRMSDQDVVLVLTGHAANPAYLKELTRIAAHFGVAERVRFAGAVGDMPAAYALADLVVAPSTKAESFGRSVVEAAAMKIPVIASPLGGPAETIIAGETGWFAAPGDIDAWARAADLALSKPLDVLDIMGETARARVQSLYSLEAMAAATFAVYRRLIEEPR